MIEGAHEGVGLGDAFLRHIQRTRVLIHLLDGMSEDPMADFSQINSELALFDPELSKKPVLVALNKIDLPEVQERWPKIKKELAAHGVKDAVAISAMARTGLEPLLWKCVELLKIAPEPVVVRELPVYRPAEDPSTFTISRTDDGGYKVNGVAIERAAKMTFWEFEGSVRRFQRLIETLGVETQLRQMGIENGDTVYIGDEHELEWQD